MSMERESHPVFDALHIPPTALEQGGVEVLRAAIVEGGLHVSLRRAFDDPEAWGMLLADVTRRLYSEQGDLNRFAIVLDGLSVSAPTTNAVIPNGQAEISGNFTQDEAVERIRAAFEQAIREPPEGSAEVTAIAKPE